MEEDAGKLIHEENGKCSVVDFNRAGVPLIEVVSKPDMSNADEVIAFVESLRLIAQYLEVSDCKLQEHLTPGFNLFFYTSSCSELFNP